MRTVEDADDLVDFDPEGVVTLRLIGTGENPIRCVDGRALDGDYDGEGGGDYETTIARLMLPVPPPGL